MQQVVTSTAAVDTSSLPTNGTCGTKRKFMDCNTDYGDQALTIFTGRHKDYPSELNKLIHPLTCELCHINMSNLKNARDHYESKRHNQHIAGWIKKNYSDIGLDPPPVKCFLSQQLVGPNAYHCDLCDLPLTSLSHAAQHYAGRKHKLVERNNNHFGVGVQFITSSSAGITCGAAPSWLQPAVNTQPVNRQLFCDICKIKVTSKKQMQIHLEGARHQKRLILKDPSLKVAKKPTKQTQLATAIANAVMAGAAVNLDDFSMFRTPTGYYYCESCNTTVNNVNMFQQHLLGKKHMKKVNIGSNAKTY